MKNKEKGRVKIKNVARENEKLGYVLRRSKLTGVIHSAVRHRPKNGQDDAMDAFELVMLGSL